MRWFSVPNKEWQIIAPFALIAPFHTILCQPGDYEPLITLLGGISAPAPDIKDNLFPKSQSVWDVKTVNLLIHHPLVSESWGRREIWGESLSSLPGEEVTKCPSESSNDNIETRLDR